MVQEEQRLSRAPKRFSCHRKKKRKNKNKCSRKTPVKKLPPSKIYHRRLSTSRARTPPSGSVTTRLSPTGPRVGAIRRRESQCATRANVNARGSRFSFLFFSLNAKNKKQRKISTQCGKKNVRRRRRWHRQALPANHLGCTF